MGRGKGGGVLETEVGWYFNLLLKSSTAWKLEPSPKETWKESIGNRRANRKDELFSSPAKLGVFSERLSARGFQSCETWRYLWNPERPGFPVLRNLAFFWNPECPGFPVLRNLAFSIKPWVSGILDETLNLYYPLLRMFDRKIFFFVLKRFQVFKL